MGKGKIKSAIDVSMSRAWYQRCLGLLIVIMLLWYAMNAIELAMNSATIMHNTDLVFQGVSRVKVSSVDKEGNLTLENGTKLESSQIKEYVRTIPKSGSYYLNDNLMSAEITQSDCFNLAVGYYVSGLVVFIGLLLYYRIRAKYARVGKFECIIVGVYLLLQLVCVVVHVMYSGLFVAYGKVAVVVFLCMCLINTIEGVCIICTYKNKNKSIC